MIDLKGEWELNKKRRREKSMCKGPVAEGVCKAIRIKRSVWLECREQVGSRGAEVGTQEV